MKISLKKLLFVVLTVFSIIFIGACGKSKFDKKEVIEKFVEVSKNMKSVDMLINMKMEEKENKDSKIPAIEMSMNSSMILEPLAMKLEIGIPNQNVKMTTFIKDDFMYILNPTDNKWYKQAINDVLGEQFKSYITNSNDIYDVMKDNIDKIDVEEKDGNYLISISKDSDFLKEAMKKQLSNMSAAGNPMANVEIDNIVVQYVVDKNTYLPSSSTMNFDMLIGGNTKLSATTDSKMSNINEVKEIALPEEAKNAQEIPKQ